MMQCQRTGQREIQAELVQISMALKDITLTVMKRLICVDGANAPVVFNSSMTATDVSESTVAGSKFVAAFRNHMFYAGKSTTPQDLVFSEPFDEDEFSSGQVQVVLT